MSERGRERERERNVSMIFIFHKERERERERGTVCVQILVVRMDALNLPFYHTLLPKGIEAVGGLGGEGG